MYKRFETIKLALIPVEYAGIIFNGSFVPRVSTSLVFPTPHHPSMVIYRAYNRARTCIYRIIMCPNGSAAERDSFVEKFRCHREPGV